MHESSIRAVRFQTSFTPESGGAVRVFDLTYSYSFIHSRLHSRARRVSDGSTMHRLAGVMYCKARVVYSKERVQNELERTVSRH